LGRFVDLPIVDQTGLKGYWDVTLQVPPVARRGGNRGGDVSQEASDPGSVSLFTTLPKVGLKLEKRRIELDQIVRDRADKTPIEN
jgi:uncharacterized protein (TIGR03435 family)